MSIVDGNWKTFMARATVLSTMLGIVVFGAVRLAVADPGGPASPDALTFAGVLHTATGAPFVGSTTLTFVFRKVGDGGVPTEVCRTTTERFNVGDGGAFSTPVSMDPLRCPRSLFDGTSIVYDVLQGTESLTPDGGVAITPVPYARFADQAGVNNDCPAGYLRDTSDMVIVPSMRRCVRRRSDGTVYDEVVRVGTGASAFWIDRYEASVWDREDGSARVFGRERDDYGDVDFPDNGQWSTQLWALSRSDVGTSRYITWFQASEACRSSGKRLPTGEEWLTAARGTVDSGSNSGMGGRCNTNGGLRQTGQGHPRAGSPGCQSVWGAEDMIGNLWEFGVEWAVPPGGESLPDGGGALSRRTWPSAPFMNDSSWVGAVVVAHLDAPSGTYAAMLSGPSGQQSGLPGAIARGGCLRDQESAGRNAIVSSLAPSFSQDVFGFRCVIPR